ncbi:hypothetical protein [Bradyrhizobium elkanii]|uniref:hypothetical protein n=1 Tax=Bradyrhizobium elkanii TaxID=29448 RepID=UPI0004B91C46|nr:hypothetical protein [Bradyrhizobium elkanii]WLA87381.1 hypothetical protein QNJ99_20195 [Bradyrhizobium elkanii]
MTSLILATSDLASYRLRQAGRADIVVGLRLRFVSDRELDFSQYNPIHRWWGGTELTNQRLWRRDAESRTLVAP